MTASFQNSNSPLMENILMFHDHSMIIIVLIVILTSYTILFMMKSKGFNKFNMEGQEIEMIWTVTPAFMLIFIAIPSMKTLYLTEDFKSPVLTMKAVGHQWYWSYESGIMEETEMECFMEKSMISRLLKCSDTVKIPSHCNVRMMVTSQDVIHSWTVPSMGSKIDAIPGRINQTTLMSKRLGLFTGQCSEICGSNHSFMPISLIVSPLKFLMSEKENL